MPSPPAADPCIRCRWSGWPDVGDGQPGAAVLVAAAAAPMVLILGAMLVWRWSAATAGAAGLVLALGAALALFDMPAAFLPGVAAEGAFLAATILWILWPALALHAHQQRVGALQALNGALRGVSARPLLQVLLVGWFVALFFEGAAGFGTPVALAAPILVGLGLPPVRAVTIALLGHAVGVSFGALGTPVAAQVALTALDPVGLAWRTALLHLMLAPVLLVAYARLLPQEGAGGRAQVVGWVAFAAAAFLLASLAIAAVLGPELPTLGGALLGGALFVLAVRRREPVVPRQEDAARAGLARALAPYAVLVALVLAGRAVPPLQEMLGGFRIEWQWQDRFKGRMQPLTHPGTLLFAALLLGAKLQGAPLRSVAGSLREAARRLVPVCLALLAMLCLSRLMLHGGLIDALQRAAVASVGSAWPLLAPAVGALGSFVTGSATASNVLFTSLQAQTAQSLGLPALWIVAAQNFGAGVGNIVCPHNVVAGVATVNATGREAEVLRQTVLPCLLHLLAGGAVLSAILLLVT